MKLHIGCSNIYLIDFVNIDAEPHFFAKDAPEEIMEMNSTTFDKYYKTGFCKGSGKVIVDIKGLSNNLPFPNNSVEEIIMLHVLEHIPKYEVGETLIEFNRVLQKGGSVILAVPDIKETAKLLVGANNSEEEDWAIRLIHGTQRNKWSHHFCGYTERTLKNLLLEFGFGNFEILPNLNFYPAIHLRAYKVKDYD